MSTEPDVTAAAAPKPAAGAATPAAPDGDSDDGAADDEAVGDTWDNTLLFIGVLAGVVIMILSLVWVAGRLSNGGAIAPEVALPVLAISGVVLLLGTLAIVSIAFRLFGLENRNQALGLPEGSIRAVIALSLIVLFGIFSVFLYSSMSEPVVESVAYLSPKAAASFKASLAAGQFVSDVKRDAVIDDKTKAETSPETHTIYFKTSTSPESVDFAKQLLTLLGTLVTAISSFYFGSKSA